VADDPTSSSFDLVVIGAGTGGYAAAFRGAQLGLRVALIDRYRIGGTCLHVGCIPTKAMLESADLVDRVRHAAEFGITVGEIGLDLGVIADRRDGIVEKMTKGLMFLVKKHKVEYIRGTATLEGATTISVATTDDAGQPTGERVLTSKDTILATGSRTKSLPGIEPDGERIVTSDHILRSREVPARLIVVGAGAVGMEFASFYADMGTIVTVLEYAPAVVPLEDAEISKEMERAFTKRGIKVITNARFDAESVKADEQGVRLMVGKRARSPRSWSRRRCSWPPAVRRSPIASASRRPGRSWSGPWSRSTRPRWRPRSPTCTPSGTSSVACGWPTSRRTRASTR